MPHIAFVLLGKAKLPSTRDLITSLTKRAPGMGFFVEPSDSGEEEGQALGVGFDGGRILVALAPIPVPKGEADHGYQFSVGAFSGKFKQPKHVAHLVVALMPNEELSSIGARKLMTRVLAGFLDSTKSVGVYWGESHVAHSKEFFLDVANAKESLWVMLWTGVSLANDGPERVSLLTLGAHELGAMNIMMNGPEKRQNELMFTMFDLLDYCLEQRKPIPHGHTTGPSTSEKWLVEHVASPVDPVQKVMRVTVP
jgi:hypothetical protein